jgi:heat shock protein HslJ/uncharacterized protein YecT (DUF1311 family)
MPVRSFLRPGAVATVVFLFAVSAHATPLQECAATDAPMACLDAKLKDANRRLNDALKQAHQRIEKLQSEGRRSVQGAFVNSQRAFNAYRDAQCGWQAIHAEPGTSGATLVKDCQILATLARAAELEAFARGEPKPVAGTAAPALEPPATESVAAAPDPVSESVTADSAGAELATGSSTAESGAAESAAGASAATAAAGSGARLPPPEAAAENAPAPAPPAAPAQGGTEWRLAQWRVDGSARELVPDSEITVAFDPSGKLAGKASVNRYNGRYGFDAAGRLQWQGQGFSVTRMAGPAALMAQERAFLETLRRMVEYGVEDGKLILKSASGRTVLTFAR